MAKTLGRDPTTNIYALLADESVSSETLSKGNKKGNTKKESESLQTPSGVVPTPAAKAQARKQKEEAAAKAAATLNAESGPLVGGTLEREHKKTGKLNRQQWNNSVDHPQQAPPNAGGGPRNIPPRQQGQGGADRDRGGEFSDRGRGGRGGGRRGGRGRSDRSLADRPPRLEENRNRDENNRGTDLSGEGHHPPRGREFDRHSQMRTPRQPYSKRAGAGKSNWGPEAEWEPAPTEEPAPATVEAVAAPLTTEVIGGWGDEGNDPGVASSETPAWGAWDNEKLPEAALESTANTLAPPSQQDKGLEDFLEEKKKKAEQLAALLGKHEVRQVEGFQRYSPKEEPNSASQEKTEKVPSPTKKSGKGKEVIPHDKLGFHLKAAPGVRRGRGGRRGGGDEERGGGGGGEDHPQEPREDRPPREPRDDRPDRAPGRGGRGRGGGRLGGGSGGGYGGGGVRGNGGYRGSGGGRGRFGKKDFPPLEELTAST